MPVSIMLFKIESLVAASTGFFGSRSSVSLSFDGSVGGAGFGGVAGTKSCIKLQRVCACDERGKPRTPRRLSTATTAKLLLRMTIILPCVPCCADTRHREGAAFALRALRDYAVRCRLSFKRVGRCRGRCVIAAGLTRAWCARVSHRLCAPARSASSSIPHGLLVKLEICFQVNWATRSNRIVVVVALKRINDLHANVSRHPSDQCAIVSHYACAEIHEILQRRRK